jgi:hypothetical protein
MAFAQNKLTGRPGMVLIVSAVVRKRGDAESGVSQLGGKF